MQVINIKKLVALDMTLNGKWLILVELIVGALGSLALAYFIYPQTPNLFRILFFIWIVGIGVNYIPPAIYAVIFAVNNRYKVEAEDVMSASENKRYNLQQFFVFIPFLFAIRSIVQGVIKKNEKIKL